MPIFTTIAFGMCAYLAQGLGQQTMLMIGNINEGICDPQMFFGDSHGQSAFVAGHEYKVDINDSGAKLWFDGKVFYFIKDSI